MSYVSFNDVIELNGILKDKEISFCKEISKVIEEMSLLEITEYTTENTLGITERKNVPTAYYNGSMAYQAGMPISYQVKDVPKGKINILDIQMKTDIMGIEEQLEAYLKEEKGNLTDAELVELKEEYYEKNVIYNMVFGLVITCGVYKRQLYRHRD
mgnify:CR=1 FL=1